MQNRNNQNDGAHSESLEPASSKELERQKLQSQIEEFLSRGGEIDKIEANVVVDPPKKPESNYGGQPL